MRLRRRCSTGSGTGIADSSASVYGCVGRRYTSSAAPFSTMRPRYITAIRSLMWRTTDEVVGDEQVREPELLLQVGQQVDHLRLGRHVERADGSSQTSSSGLQRERPAIAMRWR